MKKVLFATLVTLVLVLVGCTPVMQPRALGPEEQEWADYLKEMYPGWKVPDVLPQAVTISSRTVPYTNIETITIDDDAAAEEAVVTESAPATDAEVPEIPQEDALEDAPATTEVTEEKTETAPAEPQFTEETKSEETAAPAEKTEEGLDEEQKVEFTEYVVQKNDSLSIIAKKVYGDGNKYIHIYKANEDVIKNPNKLYPGMKLKIPVLK